MGASVSIVVGTLDVVGGFVVLLGLAQPAAEGPEPLSEVADHVEGIGQELREGADALLLRRRALASGFKTMNWDGREKIRKGITTFDEVQRVNRSHRLAPEEREDV